VQRENTSPPDHRCLDTGFRCARLLARRDLAENITEYKLAAPVIAVKAKAGQFVVLRMDEKAERLPMTIVDASPAEGWITIIFQWAGASTRRLAQLAVDDMILDLVGPLGEPSAIDRYGTVACIGGGVGIAPVFPIARALRQAGNRVISIIGARGKEFVILEDEMRSVSDELIVCTDDGTYGKKGFVSQALAELIDRGEKIDRV
jgi:NAD(P)H-flavin reductase